MRAVCTCLQDNNGLPNHLVLIVLNNVSSLFSFVLFIFSICVFYRAPVSKESVQYKTIIYIQFVIIFIFSFVWSFVAKLYIEFEYSVIYSEGYLTFLQIDSGQFFTFFVFIFGNYCTLLMISYTYRLYLVANRNHVLRKKKILSTCFALIFINNGVVGPILFSFMYKKDANLHEHPKNMSDAEIQFYESRAVVFLHERSITRTFVGYMSYSMILVILTVYYASYAIVQEIKKQQQSASSTFLKHHIRVLKTLLIQTSSSLSVLFLASTVEAFHMFVSISACFVEFAYVVLGLNFIVHSTIMLVLNSAYKNTILGKFLKRPQMVVHQHT